MTGQARPFGDASQYWGNSVYSTHDRVPLRIWRCGASMSEGNHGTHPCRQHISHIGPHRCICGKTWPRPQELPT